MNREDQEFEQRARTALDSSVTALDADTRRSLAAGRARALEQKSFFAHWMTSGTWIPATALAACAVLAVTLFVANRQPEAPLQVAQSDSDFALELLLGSDSEDEDENDENGQVAEADPDFFIVMDAMMDEEDKQHEG